jgi:hypothetical protein
MNPALDTRGPRLVRLSPIADLSPEQRRMALALRKEAARPTVRLSLSQLCGLLLFVSVVGLATGFYLGGK